MRVAVVDYGMGNVGSMRNMLRRIGVEVVSASSGDDLAGVDRIVLPGVGAFPQAMSRLRATGLSSALNVNVIEKGVPFLGVCLGMQVMAKASEEGPGSEDGLAWLDATVRRFRFDDPKIAVPHMGWNTVQATRPELEALVEGARFYFVHSYYVACGSPDDVVAVATYGFPFPSIVGRLNIAGVQFHPEKSHKFGMALLKSFASDTWPFLG